MNDRLDEVLRSTTHVGASPDFTSRVMRRIREAETARRATSWRPTLAVAALVVVSILSGIAFERHQESMRIEAIRLEARQLEAELEALKQQTRQSSEVYLGGNENKEFVLDLRELTAPSSEVQTVSHSF